MTCYNTMSGINVPGRVFLKVCRPVAIVSRLSPGCTLWQVFAFKTLFIIFIHVKVFKKMLVSHNSVSTLDILSATFSTLEPTIDYRCRDTKAIHEPFVNLSLDWIKIASCNIVDAHFRCLRGHVEPKSSKEYGIGALMDYIWIFKKIQVTCVFTLCINFGKSSVVVIP